MRSSKSPPPKAAYPCLERAPPQMQEKYPIPCAVTVTAFLYFKIHYNMKGIHK